MTRLRSKWNDWQARPYRAERSPNTDAAMVRFWGLVVAALAIEFAIALYITTGMRPL